MFQLHERVLKTSKTIDKSRFHGFLFSCRDRSEHEQHLLRLNEEFPDARHICYGFRILGEKIPQPEVGFSDDGEPNGSAGKPILAPLLGQNIVGSAIYVIRYFGGIKLGVGGLIRAYGGVANELVSQATPIPYEKKIILKITLDYQNLPSLQHHLKSIGCPEPILDFSDKILCSVEVTQAQETKLRERWQGYLSFAK